MASKYRVIVEAQINQAQLQQQLNRINAQRPVQIRAQVQMNQQDIQNQVKLWENALTKMQARTPKAFADDKVQVQVRALNQMIEGFQRGVVPIGNVRTQLDNVRTSLTEVSSAMRTTNSNGMSLNQMFDLAVKKMLVWAGAGTLLYGSLRQIQEAIGYVKDLNKELTSTAIVTGLNSAQIGALGQQYNSLAKELGATTLEVAKGALEWQRQGKSVEDTTKLLRASTMMSKLGNMDAAESTELLTSTLNGFQLSADDAITVVSKLIAVDNAFSTSTKEVATALQYSAAVANQANISFDELVAYITTISSVMRISAESVGQSLKTMVTRMEQIKVGKLFEDDPTTINQVAEALDSVNISLMENEKEFRPLGDVLKDLAVKWDTLSEKQQNAIGGTIAGIRQVPQFLTLMQNWDVVTKALGEEMNSTGLATQRFGIYLESLEAKANQFTATWERLASNAINSDFVKLVLDLGSGILGLVDKFGLLNAVITTLSIVIASKLGVNIVSIFNTIIHLRTVIDGLAASTITLTGAMTALSTVLGGVLIAVGVMAAIYAFKELNKNIVDTYNNFEKLKSQTDSNVSELNDLAQEYETLATKQNRNYQEEVRLLDIQSILATKYGATADGVNVYTDAINGNTEAIKENVRWMREKAELEARQFVDTRRGDFEEAQRTLYGKRTVSAGGMGVAPEEVENLDAYIKLLSERIAVNEKLDPIQAALDKKTLKGLIEQKYAAEQLIIEYKHYLNLLYEAQSKDWSDVGTNKSGRNLSNQIAEFEAGAEAAQRIKQQFEDLATFIDDPLGSAFEQYNEKQTESAVKAAELRAAIQELSSQPTLSPEQLTQLGDLQFQLDGVEQGIYDTAAAYEHSTRVAIINLALQRIAVLGLQGDTQATAYKMVWDLAQAWGIIGQNTRTAIETMDTAFGYLAQGTAESAALAQAEIAKLADMANSVSGNYYMNFVVTTQGAIPLDSSWGAFGELPPTVKPGGTPTGGPVRTRNQFPGFTGFSGGGGGGGGAAKEEKFSKTAQDLYSKVISLIRQQKQEEIDLLKTKQDAIKEEQQLLEDQQDALDEQLDAYGKIIDAKKESLRETEDELSYQEEIADKNKDIAKIEQELAILKLDNSAESKKRQLELEEELAGQKDDLAKTQRSHSVDEQEKALDKEYNLYKENIDKQKELLQGQIDLFDQQYEAIQKQIDAISEYLSKSGLIGQDAITMMANMTPSLYQELIKWNEEYGSGIDQDVTAAWDEATEALKHYKDLIDAIKGEEGYGGGGGPGTGGGSGGNLNWKRAIGLTEGTDLWNEATKLGKEAFLKKYPQYKTHHEGFASGPVGGISTPLNQEFLSVLKGGEIVANDRDMRNILSRLNIGDNIKSVLKQINSDINIGSVITVEGNVSKDALPGLDRIADKVVSNIADNLRKRGYIREARLFST